MTATTPTDLLAGVCCPLCAEETDLKLSLSDCRTFACGGCDEEFDVDTLQERIASYRRLIRMAAATRAAAEAGGD